MLQFDLQFYEEFTVAWVRTVRTFFWPTGQLVLNGTIKFLDLQYIDLDTKIVILRDFVQTLWVKTDFSKMVDNIMLSRSSYLKSFTQAMC